MARVDKLPKPGGSDMAVDLRRRRFTIDEYERMAETGILDEDERVELIEAIIKQ